MSVSMIHGEIEIPCCSRKTGNWMPFKTVPATHKSEKLLEQDDLLLRSKLQACEGKNDVAEGAGWS